MIRRIFFLALLVALVRVVLAQWINVGPIEWAIVVVLLVALAAGVVIKPRPAG